MSSRPSVSVTHTRASIEHASDPALQRISRMPVAGLVLGFVILVIAGVALGGIVGAILVLLAAGVVGWLAYLAWPRLSGAERLMRCAVILLLVAVAVVSGLSHALLI